ncbi:MAG TPA: SpoIVB peptidase S55 domain-containing protein [Bryobacteraceae bacterium]|nr:SpoIVB peptidase S55 domain-containing protein [Bryobacteraceae bacterium]
MSTLRTAVFLIPLLTIAAAPPQFMPLQDVRAGMQGTGRTVFAGSQVEEFKAEILGVLENVGPRQSIVLARLSGGPLERTGVMQGMSGSPVYIGGKLLGAVAMAFPFSKEPIAGIRPIGEMMREAGPANRPSMRARLGDSSLLARLPAPSVPSPDQPVEIATPLSLTGFTRSTLDLFTPELRKLGLVPVQGISGGKLPRGTPAPPPPQPGSMVSVQLVTGDMAVGADGTVTHVDGNKIWAFGHRFLSAGTVDLPFTSASVVTLLPNVNTSFKISAAGSPLGAMTADYNAAIAGELGRKARMASVEITVKGGRESKYQMSMAQDQLLSPLLLQMIVYSALDASERTLGSSAIRVTGSAEFEGFRTPVRIDNMFSGDFNVPLVAAMGAALPVAYALQNTVDPLQVRSVNLTLETTETKKQLSIENVWTSRREVRPGEPLDIFVLMAGERGREIVKQIRYEVPVGAPAGPLTIQVSDGPTANAADGRVYTLAQPQPADQVIGMLNQLRGSTKAWVRLTRSDPAYTLDGRDLPDPPPSVGMILSRLPAAQPALPRVAVTAELRVDPGDDVVITGSKTIQVEVRE